MRIMYVSRSNYKILMLNKHITNVLLLLFLGNESSWPFLFGLYAGLVLLVLPILPFVPESPRYLYTVCNDHREALSGKVVYNLIKIF